MKTQINNIANKKSLRLREDLGGILLVITLLLTLTTQAQPNVLINKVLHIDPNINDEAPIYITSSKFGGYWALTTDNRILDSTYYGHYHIPSIRKFHWSIVRLDDNMIAQRVQYFPMDYGISFYPKGIVELADGSVVVSHNTRLMPNIIALGLPHAPLTKVGYNVAVSRIDTAMNLVWQTEVGGTTTNINDQFITETDYIIAMPNGGVAISIRTNDTTGSFAATPFVTAPCIVFIDGAGNQRTQYYNLNGVNAGNPAVTFNIAYGYGYMYITSSKFGSAGSTIKADTLGNIVWEKPIGNGIPLSDGGLINLGSGCGSGPAPGVVMPPFMSMFYYAKLNRYDANGNLVFVGPCLGPQGYLYYPTELKAIDDSTFFGYGIGIKPDAPNTWQGLLVKVDIQGNLIWDRKLGGSVEETFYNGFIDPAGSIITYGRTGSADGDLAGIPGASGVAWHNWVVKFASALSTDEQLSRLPYGWQVTPLESNHQHNIQFTGEKTKLPINIKLTDIQGKVIKQWNATELSSVLDMSSYAQGIYLLQAAGYKTAKLVR